MYVSKQTEEWEKDITEEDRPKYIWEKSKSKQNIENVLKTFQKDTKVKQCVSGYATSLKAVFDQGETHENLDQLKENTLKLLKLKDVGVEEKQEDKMEAKDNEEDSSSDSSSDSDSESNSDSDSDSEDAKPTA